MPNEEPKILKHVPNGTAGPCGDLTALELGLFAVLSQLWSSSVLLKAGGGRIAAGYQDPAGICTSRTEITLPEFFGVKCFPSGFGILLPVTVGVAADSAPVAPGIFAARGVAALGVNAGDGTSTTRLVLELDERSRAPCSPAVVGLEETLSQGVNILSGFIGHSLVSVRWSNDLRREVERHVRGNIWPSARPDS